MQTTTSRVCLNALRRLEDGIESYLSGVVTAVILDAVELRLKCNSIHSITHSSEISACERAVLYLTNQFCFPLE